MDADRGDDAMIWTYKSRGAKTWLWRGRASVFRHCRIGSATRFTRSDISSLDFVLFDSLFFSCHSIYVRHDLTRRISFFSHTRWLSRVARTAPLC